VPTDLVITRPSPDDGTTFQLRDYFSSLLSGFGFGSDELAWRFPFQSAVWMVLVIVFDPVSYQ
jgi:hypothetical protein